MPWGESVSELGPLCAVLVVSPHDPDVIHWLSVLRLSLNG